MNDHPYPYEIGNCKFDYRRRAPERKGKNVRRGREKETHWGGGVAVDAWFLYDVLRQGRAGRPRNAVRVKPRKTRKTRKKTKKQRIIGSERTSASEVERHWRG